MRFFSSAIVAAALVFAAPVAAQTPTTAAAPPAVQKEFDGFLTKFRAALKAKDSAAIARMVKSENNDKSEEQGDVKQALKDRACLLSGKATYALDGDNHDTYTIFCGQTLFSFAKTGSEFFLTGTGAND